ncbi:hypothetical protein BV360_01792 [Pseudomonas syringae pv. actinidiae]|nr:hypothetical protein BV340_01710 [Pseudomonas syringae pv. actinidiae]OSN27456.1 hypothetical protein BV341_01636 [Pseudomonas syringae pv. actinidiae]OSN38123.1 hypothetical protein BV342_01832 [Pseudomonas syringae pv. actinidiae]OSN61316.1 hypothetical protein BV347_01533 [Pseudomonas syringae pv. actinidiae]OSN72947.1 hypothetical protein BV350_01491 [Pseudomonas syringae pv. actinidiae]
MRLIAEHERQVEDVDVRHYRADDAEADAGHLDRAALHLLDHFLLGAEHAAGVHLEGDLALGLLLELFAHVLLSHDWRVACGMNLGELDFDVCLG